MGHKTSKKKASKKMCPQCSHEMKEHEGDGEDEPYECTYFNCGCYYYKDV